jgi:TM2 domain-containing membrane protein YozV
MENQKDTHMKTIGYILWFWGFTGAHRFYYGKPITGTIWFFTFGLFLIGWIIDLFLIPFMDEKADLRFEPGKIDYNVAWILLTFFGPFGVHRFYMGKWITGFIYLLCTTLSLIGGVVFIAFLFAGGFLLIAFVLLGYVYDFWTLNQQISEINA